jgi:hypothetical protein
MWERAWTTASRFWERISIPQKTCVSAEQPYYEAALASGNDQALPADPFDMSRWGQFLIGDFCTTVTLPIHVACRRGNLDRFIAELESGKAPHYALHHEHGVATALLQAKCVRGDGRAAIERVLASPPDRKRALDWIRETGFLIVETGDAEMLERFFTAYHEDNPDPRDNIVRVMNQVRSRLAIETLRFDEASALLSGTVVTSLHDCMTVVFQCFLSSLGYLKRPDVAGLKIAVDRYLAGQLKDLALMFLGVNHPRPGDLWPDRHWIPERRLWLALWLEAKGDLRGALETAKPALDPRYGEIHSQPGLRALISRLEKTAG